MSEKAKTFRVTTIDHVLVTGKGGLIKTRDREETFEGDEIEMKKRINGRFDRYHPISVQKCPNKAKREENEKERIRYSKHIDGQLSSIQLGQTITKTVKVDGRPRFTYRLSVVNPFGHATPSKPVKQAVVHYGLGTEEDKKAALERLYATRKRLGMNPDGTPYKPEGEHTELDAKPKQGKANKPKQQANKKPDKKVDTKKSGVLNLNSKQKAECEKFKLDVANLPDEKPKGMNKRVWSAIQQKAKAVA